VSESQTKLLETRTSIGYSLLKVFVTLPTYDGVEGSVVYYTV